MVPVGARLDDWKLVDEGLAGLDAREADPRNAIHLERHQNAVPVDGGVFVEGVGDGDADPLAFLQAKERPRYGAVDGYGMAALAVDGDRRVADRQLDVLAGKRGQGRDQAGRRALRPGGQERADRRSAPKDCRPFDQGAAVKDRSGPGHSKSYDRNNRHGNRASHCGKVKRPPHISSTQSAAPAPELVRLKSPSGREAPRAADGPDRRASRSS